MDVNRCRLAGVEAVSHDLRPLQEDLAPNVG